MTLNHNGLTLLEIIVAIAIVGLLAALWGIADHTAKLKSRDAERLVDLRHIQEALKLFYDDQTVYPVGSDVRLGDGAYSCLAANGFTSATSSECVNAYLPTIPRDPLGGYYMYSAVSSTYQVTAKLEGVVSGYSGIIHISPGGISQ